MVTEQGAKVPLLRPTCAHVSLAAIAHNTRVLLSARPSTRLCAVVKADAYGHGATAVARTALAAGAHGVAVALVEEGVALRKAGIAAPIYVLAGHYLGAYATVVAHGLTPVLGQALDLAGMQQAAAAANTRLDVHLELDTGMARLGWPQQEAGSMARAAATCTHLKVVGLMTHLSHADELTAPSNPAQIAAIDRVVAQVAQVLPHCANNHVLNSGGMVCTPPEHPWGMVRCGLALYGVQPVTGRPLGPLTPALRWVTKPVALRRLAPGDPVSYGSHWRAGRPSVIATLPVGYADGYPRIMTHKAHVLVGGQRVPVVGTICMDLCMVDVTDVPGITLDSEVVLLGTQGAHTVEANTLAAWANTIGYEILARIGARVPRIYQEAPPCS